MTRSAFAVSVDDAVTAEVRSVDGRPVLWFTIAGGIHHGAIGIRGGETVARAIRSAGERGIPIVGVLDSSGAEIGEGISALHGWGLIAREFALVSGVVPTILAVTGICVSGPALLLGLADAVILTDDAIAYVSGPQSVEEFTGIAVSRDDLGGARVHATVSGLASITVADAADVDDTVARLLEYLPSNNLEDPPLLGCVDIPNRQCGEIAAILPTAATAAYDVRDIIDDIVDTDSFLELRAGYAPNAVVGFARLAGRSIGIVANQPGQRAGTLDIEASRKAARFVAWCDAFNIALLTLVDTPGFEPGRDLEWRGMIRHGAQLVHAYCQATVPRVCVIMRKAFGGAYIVMDSRGIGNDVCFAWPSAEIAVMGASGAVQILGKKGLTENEYTEVFLNPWRAAERGLVDDVLDPADTRRALVAAFDTLVTKRIPNQPRKHSNGPL